MGDRMVSGALVVEAFVDAALVVAEDSAAWRLAPEAPIRVATSIARAVLVFWKFIFLKI
jgi:hypothetical protein